MTQLLFDWVEINGGPFAMGTDPPRYNRPYPDELPRHRVRLKKFEICRSVITNGQYAAFVSATGHQAPGHWPDINSAQFRTHHPVTYIDWFDAQAFCNWAGVRLPTEAEWEKTARGVDGRTWPWGEALPTARNCNCENFVGDTVSVECCMEGASSYGALGMAGNVWEWTQSIYRDYPYVAEDGREYPSSRERRVVRGGTYNHPMRNVRCADRHAVFPSARDLYIGLRVVKDYQSQSQVHLDFDWLTVPAGEFVMGNNVFFEDADTIEQTYTVVSRHSANRPADIDNEKNQHLVTLPTFQISKVPITNRVYQQFVIATGYSTPGHWFNGHAPVGLAEHPVVYVDWHDANAFCRWAQVRLPTEAEWEKAARSFDGRQWPWGNRLPDITLANFGQDMKSGTTTQVGAYMSGASSYGVLDMAGNVWEWVSSAYRPYPYSTEDGREEPVLPEQRVLRGGSFYSDHSRYLRCATRSMSYPDRRRDHIGFRVVAAR